MPDNLKLYNFLSKKIEEFEPVSKVVSLYTCGPTVYDFVHIGNWRTFVFEDVLKRVLSFNGYKVKHVMNITDIDDKIIKASSNQRLALSDFTRKYEEAFFDDLGKLNILKADFYPKATENIDSMIRIIEVLLSGGFAYKTEDGVYFDISKFPSYGKLSNLKNRKVKAGARVAADQYEKDSPYDFALWKFPQPNSSPGLELGWEAPFGRGRPGWHIECSAMSMNYLSQNGRTIDHVDKASTVSLSTLSSRPKGSAEPLRIDRFKTIDIHCGGVDLVFPHHENEIAQSEAVTSQKFVNFFLEGEHLLVEGEKMAKSLGNIFTLSDIKKRGFDPLSLRYLFLTAHYRTKLNFTWKSLEAAQSALEKLRGTVTSYQEPKVGCAEFEGRFKEAIGDDLDIPGALAVMWEMVKSDYPERAKHQSILVMDQVLGLGLAQVKKPKLAPDVKRLIEKREELRKAGDFGVADQIRQKLKRMGVVVEDTASGPKLKIVKK